MENNAAITNITSKLQIITTMIYEYKVMNYQNSSYINLYEDLNTLNIHCMNQEFIYN